jgi:hypothetical protein
MQAGGGHVPASLGIFESLLFAFGGLNAVLAFPAFGR